MFDHTDHPKSMVRVGRLPLVVSLMICDIQVTRMLMDGGTGLNVLSLNVFKKMQVPPEHRKPTQPFHGVTPGLMVSLRKVSLMVTFGTRENYRTKSIVFDVAEFDLPYNGILGFTVLMKFLVVSHYAYLFVDIPRPRGLIIVPADLQSSIIYVEKLYMAAATSIANDENRPECSGPTTRRMKLSTDSATLTKEVLLRDDATRIIKIGDQLTAK